jgi:PIN domain
VVIVVSPAVLAECVLVLESFYEHPRDIASALGRLISSPGVEIAGAAIHLDALDRYRETRVHFVDSLIAATAAAENTPVASFDQAFAICTIFGQHQSESWFRYSKLPFGTACDLPEQDFHDRSLSSTDHPLDPTGG